MANPFHHPETGDAVYHNRTFDQDKQEDMAEFRTLLAQAANNPASFGLHQHDTREVHEGLGLVRYLHDVIYWEVKNNGVG